MKRIRYKYIDADSVDWYSFHESLLDGDAILGIGFLDVDTCFGFVGIQFETMGWMVLGAAGTWLEFNGNRYETLDDFGRLAVSLEREKIEKMLEKM